jgi:hypothetical protein
VFVTTAAGTYDCAVCDEVVTFGAQVNVICVHCREVHILHPSCVPLDDVPDDARLQFMQEVRRHTAWLN